MLPSRFLWAARKPVDRLGCSRVALLTRAMNLSQSVSPLLRFFRKEYKSLQALWAFFPNVLMCSAQKVTDLYFENDETVVTLEADTYRAGVIKSRL